ncbi:MAG: hemerythrin family protein [Spirochaetaceae bacterium]|nr:hemerythrin family protein [Myxococcales bacterium]MCB9725296.1 hemerythrin family protein [Spirochaetaceae bacterium]HPG24436.1 bacteriohemerythrin [Myxococcota bacterium]
MTVLAWSDAFDVGVDKMNEEHQRLIDLMNRLHDLYEGDASRSEQKKTFDELAKYTVKHFADEEAYMESIEWPGLVTHRHIHAKLLDDLGTHKAAFDKGGELSSKLFSFLKIWLKAHIQGIDRKYGGR